MDGWMDAWIGILMDGGMEGWIKLDGWLDGQIATLMDGWVDKGMDGWLELQILHVVEVGGNRSCTDSEGDQRFVNICIAST